MFPEYFSQQLEDEIRLASTWMSLPSQRPALTMCDLQNLIMSSVGNSEYSLSVLSKLFEPFMGWRRPVNAYKGKAGMV